MIGNCFYFCLYPVPFHWLNNCKWEQPGTSYLSLWVAKHVYKNFIIFSDPLNLKSVVGKVGKWQYMEYLKNEKSFVEEIKTIFNKKWCGS